MASASALLDRFRGGQLVALGARFQLFEQMLGGVEADVAGQQQAFQLFEQFVIDLAAREQRFQLAAKLRARARRPPSVASATKPSPLRRRPPALARFVASDGWRLVGAGGLASGDFLKKPNMGLSCLKGGRNLGRW
jgi:hypothetical protein